MNKLLLQDGFDEPRKGKHDDQAHPPIHPVATATQSDCQSEDEWKMLHMIVSHFLASCSKPAKADRVVVDVAFGVETFSCQGSVLKNENFLEVWKHYEPWRLNNSLPSFRVHERVPVETLVAKQGVTEPPQLLSEVELITLMDKHGVGTDATMHEHIRTIETRQYVERLQTQGTSRFQPTVLGVTLFDGYEACSTELTSPESRGNTETLIGQIAAGARQKDEVIDERCRHYIHLFNKVGVDLPKMEQALARTFGRAMPH